MKSALSPEQKSQLRSALIASSIAIEHSISMCKEVGYCELAKYREEVKARVDAALDTLEKICLLPL